MRMWRQTYRLSKLRPWNTNLSKPAEKSFLSRMSSRSCGSWKVLLPIETIPAFTNDLCKKSQLKKSKTLTHFTVQQYISAAVCKSWSASASQTLFTRFSNLKLSALCKGTYSKHPIPRNLIWSNGHANTGHTQCISVWLLIKLSPVSTTTKLPLILQWISAQQHP